MPAYAQRVSWRVLAGVRSLAVALTMAYRRGSSGPGTQLTSRDGVVGTPTTLLLGRRAEHLKVAPYSSARNDVT